MKTADANDILYALRASRDYDPGPGSSRSSRRCSRSTRPTTSINPPELGILEREITRVPKGRAIVIPLSDDRRPRHAHAGGGLEGVSRRTAEDQREVRDHETRTPDFAGCAGAGDRHFCRLPPNLAGPARGRPAAAGSDIVPRLSGSTRILFQDGPLKQSDRQPLEQEILAIADAASADPANAFARALSLDLRLLSTMAASGPVSTPVAN